MNRMTRVLVTAALLSPVTLLPVAASLAQTPAPAPAATASRGSTFSVIVTAGEVPLRCGDSTLYYPVALVKSGDLLQVDGETANWLRVRYPAGVEAIVPADQLTDPVNNVGRLRVPSRLRAPNLNGGAKGSFYQLLQEELPANTELRVTRTIRADDGLPSYYVITPPADARAWISRDAVRRATPDEVAKAAVTAAATPAPAPAPAATETAVAIPTPAPAAVPAPEPAVTATAAPAATTTTTTTNVSSTVTEISSTISTPAPATTTSSSTSAAAALPAPAPAPVNLPAASQPMPAPAPTVPAPAPVAPTTISTTPPPGEASIPMTRPVDEGKDGPVVSPSEIGRTFVPGGTSTTTTTTTTTTTGALVPGSSTVEGLRLNINQLAESFNRVMRQPLATAEFETALAQIETFRASLSSSARDQKLSAALGGYADALRLRMELRDAKRSSEASLQGSTLTGTDLGNRVIELERQRIYNVIGRLVRSTVYSGDRVPLLYRVMSPEPGSARTLGYLLPDDKFDLPAKLEQVVGIIGQIRPEESLRTNLIVPSRVDVVSLAPIVVSPDIPGVVLPRTERDRTPVQTPTTAPELAPQSVPQMPVQRVPGESPAEPEKP